MTKKIEPQLSKICDYLKLDRGVIFSIPNYQRPYSWGFEQCDKLWQDIIEKNEEVDGTDNYFFGTIIISCSDNDTVMNLIDGQQRTTTFILLLKALLMRINESLSNFVTNDNESIQLLLGLKDKRRRIIQILYGKDPEYVTEMPNAELDKLIYHDVKIIENNSNNEDYSEDINHILKASSFDEAEKNAIKKYKKQKDNKYSNYFRNFKKFYEEKCNLSESNLNKIAKTFLDKCEIIAIKSWDLDQAIKMFNSLNSDGLPLCDSDIISSLLYSAAKNQGNLDTYEENWKELREIIKPLEEKKILSIDSLLMQEMYYERTKNGETVNSSGSIDVTTPGLRYYFKHNGKFINNPINSSEKLINLARIWEKVSEYPIIKVLFKFNENSKLFLASYFSRFNADDIIEQKYLNHNELDKEMISNLSDEEVKKLEQKLEIKKENDKLFECMLRLFTILELEDIGYSSNKFKTFLFLMETKMIDPNISVDEIKAEFDKHIQNNWTPYKITENIENYEKHNLVILNEYIYAKNNGLAFDIDDQYNIEHIMPASGKEIEGISRGALMEDLDEFNLFVNKIGNKILLESKINQSVSNTWFRMKITSTIKNNGYQKSKYPLAKHLVEKYKDAENKACWTKFDISNATSKAAEKIVKFIFEI